ncbi:MAG TPA: class I SAM-dependent methyltransferase [Ignavibacteriaceae bacterium]|nr:class I SAM-dependent methyltransferase [Ignavibacteriaceae bacterium]
MSYEWFKEWFETDEYLNVYQHRNESEAEVLVDLILNSISLERSSKVLDMACGTGRHSILFARKGFDVTAVDLSWKMLSTAQKKTEDENLKIKFIQSDLRNFAHSGKFDLIVNLFTSIGYFESDSENFRILKTAYDHLISNGFFVLDFFNRNFVEKNLNPESREKIKNGEVIQKRKIDGLRVNKKIIVTNSGHSKEYFESVRMFSEEELVNELIRIGFAIEKTFGDFHGNKFEQYSSPRIIIIARK